MEGQQRKNIFLIGFMGAGKSTVARKLQSEYGMRLIEMDEQIERQEGMSIVERSISAGLRQSCWRALAGRRTRSSLAAAAFRCGSAMSRQCERAAGSFI